MIGLKEVYKIDAETGNAIGLKDISSKLAPAIPKRPHCQRPVPQNVMQRYNRLINRAVIDEMAKRFIVTRQTDLQKLEIAFLGRLAFDLNQVLPRILCTIRYRL